MRIVIGVIAIIISFILIAAAMWEFFNMEEDEMKEEKYGDSYGEQFRKLEDKIQELKETLTQTIENDEVAYETLKLHDEEEIAMLKAQIEEMKSDVLSLIKDKMNDDIDQNIIERLAEKWEIKEK